MIRRNGGNLHLEMKALPDTRFSENEGSPSSWVYQTGLRMLEKLMRNDERRRFGGWVIALLTATLALSGHHCFLD